MTSKCSLCDKPAIARGWCWGHYRRWRDYGDAEAPPLRAQRRSPDELCLTPKCFRKRAFADGLCVKCHKPAEKYQGRYKHGGRGAWAAGCRCDKCTAGCDRKREYKRQQHHRRRSGDLPDTAQHGYSAAINYGCRCPICLEAVATYNREHPPRLSEGARRKARRRSARRAARRNAESLERASNRYKPWTGPELEIVARTDLSVREIATALSRTVYAVQRQRFLLRSDPKVIQVAGIGKAQ